MMMMMIFSRVGSISRSSRSRNVLRGVGGVRSAASTDVVARLPLIGAIDHRPGVGLGFLRGYVTAIGAHRELVSQTNLSDLHYILARPGIRRFFSNEAPKKENYVDFYLEEAKEIPKGSEEKSESKEEDSNADDRNNCLKFLRILLKLGLIWMVIFAYYALFPLSGEAQQISFQYFKNKLLEPGLVDHIDVSLKSVAQVYLKSSPRNQTSDDLVQGTATGASARGHGAQCKYYLNIASVESFKEELVDAQEALGIDPVDYVPFLHVSKVPWQVELMGFLLPAFMLVAMGYTVRKPKLRQIIKKMASNWG